MADKIARELAASTEELTAQTVSELSEAEISAVAGGMMSQGAEVRYAL
jgi:hypothetical protein